jgi:1,3-beta-glucan synthase
MAARHRPSRSQEGHLTPSPPADMGEPYPNRNYYDTDAEHSETFHRDNYGSESSAAGLNDYDQPDPYGSSFPYFSFTYQPPNTLFPRSTRYRFGS